MSSLAPTAEAVRQWGPCREICSPRASRHHSPRQETGAQLLGRHPMCRLAGIVLTLAASLVPLLARAQRPEEPEEVEIPQESPAERTPYTPPAGLQQPRTVCHGRTVRHLDVEGGRRVAEDDIRATMEIEAGGPCSDPEITRDAQALWDLGLFDDIVFTAEAVGTQEVDLQVRVKERPAIGKVVFEGNDALENSDLDEKVSLRTGEVLSVPGVQRQVGRLRDAYAEEGYFLASVRYELSELENNEVEVRFIIDEGEEVAVRSVRFVGNENLSPEDIQSFMRTSATGFFSFIASDDTFNRQYFEEDVQRIQALYYDRGYLAVEVGTPKVDLTPDRQHIDISIPIKEGPRFRIGRLSIAEVNEDGEEVEPIGGRRKLRELLDIEPDDWFSRSSIAQSLLSITRVYRDEGYAKAELSPQTDLDIAEETVDVVVSIQRGPPVRIERINIEGNTKTRDQVIRRNIEIVEGDLYSQSAVEEARRRITALGFFERVDISEATGSASDRIVLNVEIAERSTGTFQLGAGFSSIETFIFTAQIQQQNFLGRGQSLSAQLQLSGIRQLAQVRFFEPWFLGSQWRTAIEGFKTIRQFNDFTQDSTGGSLTVGHPLFDNRFSVSLRYRGEFVNITERGGGLFGSVGTDVRGLRQFSVVPIAGLFRDGITSSLQLSASWDSRNDPQFPTSGVFANYSVETADSIFGSENVFVRHRAFFRLYQQLFGPFVLKLNTDFGLITSRDPLGVPVFERFFLGGIFNVRGFRLNALGPRVGLPSGLDPAGVRDPRGIPVGGNFKFHYNLEIEFAIISEVGIRGVIFTDGGNAWNLEDRICEAPQAAFEDSAADPCSFNPLNLRTSWGFGIRWVSPLGPLRFELGFPFQPRSFEQGSRFEFTIGNFF